jgi:AcrR family transcriptional regulator
LGRHKQLTDEALLAVARQAFVAEGNTPSTREVARRAGVSEAVIYQRFGSKDAFFLAALTPPILDVDALFQRRGEPQVREHLERLASEMLVYFRTLVPVLIPLITTPDFDFEQFARAHPQSPIHQLRVGLAAHLRDLRARHEIGDVDTDAAALTLFATVFSLAMFERLGAHDAAFASAAVTRIIDTLWTGLRPAA